MVTSGKMFGDSMCDRHPEDWGLYVHFILHSLLSPIFIGHFCLYSSLLRLVSLSALSSLLSISFFVLCLRVSFSCYMLLAVYSRYCFAFDGVSSRGAVGKWDKFGPSRNLQRLSMMNLPAYPQFPTWWRSSEFRNSSALSALPS